jgi:putative membrane protein
MAQDRHRRQAGSYKGKLWELACQRWRPKDRCMAQDRYRQQAGSYKGKPAYSPLWELACQRWRPKDRCMAQDRHRRQAGSYRSSAHRKKANFAPQLFLELKGSLSRLRGTQAMQSRQHSRYDLTLLMVFLVIVLISGFDPRSRVDWALENLLVLLLVGTLVAVAGRFRLSTTSITLVFAFLCVHELGAHYTYSLVPYEHWSSAWLGFSFERATGIHRNYYDRLVHLSYGLLLVYPVREVLGRLTPLRGFWLFFVTLNIMLSTSAVYELVEWIGGAFLGNDTANAFVGAQNDPWDSQKDMAIAVAGAFASLLLVSLRGTAQKQPMTTACRKKNNLWG